MPPLSRQKSQQISSRNDFCGFEGWHHSPELAGAGLGGLKLEMLMIEIGERGSCCVMSSLLACERHL
jgi:hypothetical protein